MTPEKVVPLIRDLGMFAVGAWSFTWAVTHGPHLGAMGISAVVMSGPTFVAAWASLSAILASPSSRPSVEPPPSPPPSRSSSSGAAEP